MKNTYSNTLDSPIFHALSRDDFHHHLILKTIISILILISGVLWLFSPPHLTTAHTLLALGIIWCGLTPTIIYLYDKNRPPFPFLPLFGLFYAIWFGFSSFNDEIKFFGGQTEIKIEAFYLILGGMVILFFFFYLSKFKLWKNISAITLPRIFPLSNLRIILWGLLLINFASIVFPSISQLPSINHIFRPFGEAAYGVFFVLWLRGYLSKMEVLIIFILFFSIKVMSLASSGAVAKPLFFLLFLIFVYWFEKKRIPYIFLISIVIIFIIINPAKSEFRQLTWKGGLYHDFNFIDKGILFGNLVYKHHFVKGNLEPRIQSTKKNLNRLNHISEFSQVIELTPRVVPFWDGETYKGLITKIIPRALWPEKPIYRTGNDFGRRYKIISAQDISTAVNLQWTMEMYANYGIKGVFIGMGLVGILLGFMEKKFNQPNMTYLEYILGLIILLRLSQPETSLIETFGVIAQISLSIYIIFQVGLRFKIR